MAPKYVAPGPIGIANRFAGNSGGGGGGGFGGYFQARDATGGEQSRLDIAGLEGRIQGDLSNQRFVQQSYLAGQAAELDAWQYQQRVTEQEALQMRQDERSLTAIDQDPTMTPVEKMQAKTRIKTRVDWVSERQKRDLQQAQIVQKKAEADKFESQAELLRRKNTFDAQSMTGMSKVDIDDNALPDLKQYMADAFPWLTDANDPRYLKEINARALEIGAGRKYVIDPKTGGKIADPYELERMKHKWSADAGGSAGARSSSGGGPTEETAKIAAAAVKDASAHAAKLKKDDPTVNEEEEYNKYLARYQKHLGDISPDNKQKAAAKQQDENLGKIEVFKSDLKGMQNISQFEREAGGKLLAKMADLTKRYPSGKRPAAIEAQLNGLLDQWEAMQGVVNNRQAPGQAAAQPAASPAPAAPSISRFGGSPESQMIANTASGAVDAVGEGIKRFASWANIPSGQ